ncbi:M91 family zinc metallopeptidase [Lysobacter sp. A03]|uniref:M91 family zinc metallopeptidase n=1 Tax=Lysobacter sp. A03 TaxID=1199154 RepID=UPI0005B6DE80|nr:M91 family zinc metallopeptidase [Lysobacter sp. A03]KIQ97459.1 Alkaline phosphatase [Lysobacter sp. A03]
MSLSLNPSATQSSVDPRLQANDYWNNPAARESAPPTCVSTADPVGEGSGKSADAVEIQGSSRGKPLPPDSTPDGKTVERAEIHKGEQVDITREQTMADAGYGRTYVSSDQLVLTTGAGDDRVNVGQRDDGTLDVTVNGEQYEMRLGESQELTIRAGAGDDVICVAPNVKVNIVVDGGDGNDFIQTGSGDDRIDGGAGEDTIITTGGRNDIFGNSGNDTIHGGGSVDVIHGGDGDDTIHGGAGDNFIEGGAGNDVIHGGNGNNIISGGRGDDMIRSGTGNDVIYTGSGRNQVETAGGNNVIHAQSVGDLINSATAANDTVVNVEIDPSLGQTIKVEGSDAFTQRIGAELDMLRASPVGQKMLAEFDAAAEKKGNVVTIRELAAEQNGYAQTFSRDADIVNGRPGAGGDVTISYNPSFHMDAFPTPIGVLYHEMSHAYNGVNGTFQPGTYRGEGPDSGSVPNAERQAVGLETSAPAFDFDGDPSTPPTTANPDHLTENGFREELGLPDRPNYTL